MATTPNYGWVMPDPTDFVTNLPADFEVFGDAVDADLAGLLGGTTGQILTKDSNTDHDFSWQTPAGGITGWTLLNTGGTALTGSTTISVTGISNRKQIMCIVLGASTNSASGSPIGIRPNNDSAANYTYGGVYASVGGSYATGILQGDAAYSTADRISIGNMSTNASSDVSASVFIDTTDTTGWKRYIAMGQANYVSSGNAIGYLRQGIWESSAAVTSITIFSDGGNFDAGTLYVLGAS